MKYKRLALFAVMILLLLGFWFYFYSADEEKPQNNGKPARPEENFETSVDYHASFLVFTDGIRRVFTAPMYHNLSEDVYIEAANSAVVHVTKRGITWRDFFATLPFSLTKECLVTGDGERLCNSSGKQLKFYLNGELAPDLLEKVINPQDLAVIIYGSESGLQIEALLKRAEALSKD